MPIACMSSRTAFIIAISLCWAEMMSSASVRRGTVQRVGCRMCLRNSSVECKVSSMCLAADPERTLCRVPARGLSVAIPAVVS